MMEPEHRLPANPADADPPTIVASAMHQQYGGLLRVFFERFFGPIDYPRERADNIRSLASRGVIVYVARARSTWLALYFNFALHRIGLPLASFVGGINLLLWQPVDRIWKLLRQQTQAVEKKLRERYRDKTPTRREKILAEVVCRGEAAFLFLQGRARRMRRHGRPTANDYLQALVAVQRTLEYPIFLVPHAVANRNQGGMFRNSLRERIFGQRRRPGQRRALPLPLTRRAKAKRAAVIRVGDPVDLAQLIADHPDVDDVQLARRARHELDRRITDEERVVAGPELLTPDRLARRVLRNPRLQEVLVAEQNDTHAKPQTLKRRAAKYLREIAAHYDITIVRLFAGLMTWVFTRIYDGFVVDEPGLAKVIEAARRGPIVYCPAHRSHVDYLALSTILWNHDLTPPHIAAGANLAFFPMGTLFRRSGAFFLRRAFRDNRLYATVFRLYIAELLRQGTSLEFFVEGTRSRTGKVLMPRLGLISMVTEAWRHGVRDDITFVPVSIDYERIIEAGSYERELRGDEKRPEDIAGVLRSVRVLRSRYGRVHVQFGEPVSLAEFARAKRLPLDPSPEHDHAWRIEVERLGYSILHRVATSCSVTPTAVAATALLAHPGRGLSQSTLERRTHDIVDYLDSALARMSTALIEPQGRTAAVLEAVQGFVDQGMVTVDRPGRSDLEPIYRAIEDRRIQLDYYKNAVMNYMVPAALVSRSLRRRGLGEATYADLRADTRFLSRLFKREFLYRADSDFETYLDESLASLAVRGLLDVFEDGRTVVRDAEAVSLLAGLLDSFVEAYWVTALTVGELRRFPLWHKELRTRALERARRAFLEGDIKRPESASRTLIENALAWMLSTGVLELAAEGKRRPLRLGAKFEAGGLDDLIADLAAFL